MAWAKVGSFADTFDGPGFNAEWTLVASPVITAGQAHMPTTATKSRIVPKDYFDWTGSGVSVQVPQAGGAVGTGTVQNMVCIWDLAPNNYAQFYVQEQTIVYLRANAGVQVFPWSAAYSAATHAYWRIRVFLDSLYAETSADGINWTVRDVAPLWFDPAQGWCEFGSQLTSGTAADFVIDNYNVLPAPPASFQLITARRPLVTEPGVPGS